MEDATTVRENLSKGEAFNEFLGTLRECIAAVAEGKVDEFDVEREVEGEETVRIKIRR